MWVSLQRSCKCTVDTLYVSKGRATGIVQKAHFPLEVMRKRLREVHFLFGADQNKAII